MSNLMPIHFRAWAASAAIFGGLCFHAPRAQTPADTAWINLIQNFSDWDLKLRYQNLNVNWNNTFQMVGGVLTVDYSNYVDFTNEPFGHACYKVRPFSYYYLRAEYQVWGNQVPLGPGWALQNNGFMLHSQSMASMGLNQDFPMSLEAQLLGPGNGSSTMNLCTPGSAFYTTATGGTVNLNHCINATSQPRAAVNTGWQPVSALVLADSVVRHYVNNVLVLTYYRTVQYQGNVSGNTITITNNAPLNQGYITIQAESHPYRFRRIDVVNLMGCMTVGNANYKSYLIKHDPNACATTGVHEVEARASMRLAFAGRSVSALGSGNVTLEVFGMNGKSVGSLSGKAPLTWNMPIPRAGVYYVKAFTEKGSFGEKTAQF